MPKICLYFTSCSIINNEGSLVSVTPIGDAPTYVNGNLISEPAILHHVRMLSSLANQ